MTIMIVKAKGMFCDECDQEAERIIRLGETEYPARWMYVCASCLDLASRAIANDGEVTVTEHRDTITVPEEVMEEAKAIFVSLPKEGRALQAIARALISAEARGMEKERERCARLIEDDSQWTFAGNETAMAVFEDVRELAAAAIRNGTEASDA